MPAGYQVFAINPLSASRYRERHVCGTRRLVLARVAGNKRLRDALYLQASPRSAGHRAPAPTTTATANAATPTTKPYPLSRTGSSGSSTAACATGSPTTKPPHQANSPQPLDFLRTWDV